MELPHDLLYNILLYADIQNVNELESLCTINNTTLNICHNKVFWKDKMVYFGYDKLIDKDNINGKEFVKINQSVKKTNDLLLKPYKYASINIKVYQEDLYKLDKIGIDTEDIMTDYQLLNIIIKNNKYTIKYMNTLYDVKFKTVYQLIFDWYYDERTVTLLTYIK